MAVQWVRLDTAFASHPKVLALLREREGHRAGFVYLCALAYVGAQGTDGFVPQEALPFVHGRKSDAQRLVDCGLWSDQPGGWTIHGWMEKQESTEETQQRRVRAQAGAQARWNGHTPMTNAERQKLYRERHRNTAK